MQFSDRDRQMIVLGMAMARPGHAWVKEVAAVLPPNGDFSSEVMDAIASEDEGRLRAALPGLGVGRSGKVRRGIICRAIWDASRKYINTLCQRVAWSYDEQDRKYATDRLNEYQQQVDSLLERWRSEE